MDTKKFKESLEAAKADIKAYRASRDGAANTSPENKSFKDLEKSVAKKFGVSNLNELIKINTSAKQYKHIALEQREAVKSLKEAVDVALMCATVFKKSPTKTQAYAEMVEPALKAFGIDSGDVGYSWIPTMVSESYFDEYNLERKVAGLFQEIKMPSSPYDYPILSNGAIATKVSEAAPKSTKDVFAASKLTMTAVKLSNQYLLPEELQEDSAVDVMKVIRQELIEGQEKALEIAIIEGDLTSTHQHTNTGIPGQSSTPAADSPERVFKGLRKRALAASLTVDAGGAALNESHLRDLRKMMGKFGVNPSELALICGPKGYNEMMDLDDVRTLEQYGPQAPVLTGELAKYEGIPVIVSEWLREDTNSAGVNGASANTFTGLILVNRKRHLLGLRRPISVKVENNRTDYDSWDMVSFSRRAFEGVAASSTEQNVALLFHVL